jgi:hypothetical protein
MGLILLYSLPNKPNPLHWPAPATRWFRSSRKSPLTGARLANKSLTPNHAMKQTIAELRQEQIVMLASEVGAALPSEKASDTAATEAPKATTEAPPVPATADAYSARAASDTPAEVATRPYRGKRKQSCVSAAQQQRAAVPVLGLAPAAANAGADSAEQRPAKRPRTSATTQPSPTGNIFYRAYNSLWGMFFGQSD